MSSLPLRGDSDLTLKSHPAGSLLSAGPMGVEIGPETALRCILPRDMPVEAPAILVEIRFALRDTTGQGTLLSFRDASGNSLSLRNRSHHLMLQSGRARVGFPRTGDGAQTVSFALTASGRLILIQDDGVIDDLVAFDPVEILQITQIHVANQAPMMLHDVSLQVLDTAEPAQVLAALRDRVEARIGKAVTSQKLGTPLLIHFNGQSLALGPSVPAEDRLVLGSLARADLRMLTDVFTGEARRIIDLSGLQKREGPVESDDARLDRVRITGPLPPALAMAQALAGRDNDATGPEAVQSDPIRLAPIALSGNPIAGESLAMLDDPRGPSRRNMDIVLDAMHQAFARESLMPERIVYFWIQGEADRSAEPGAYLVALIAHWNRIRARLDDLYPRSEKTIFLMQTAGSDQSHHKNEQYHPAADQLHFVADRRDAVMVGPVYPSRLSDYLHPDLHHSRIMGELAAWALREVQAGRPWSIGAPALRRDGDRITLDFALREDEALTAHDLDVYGGQGIDAFLGLEVEGGQIQSVELDGHALHLTVTGPVTQVSYAMQRQNMREVEGNAHPARRGLIRTTLTRPAVHLADTTLYRWLPSFAVDL
ncbi:hypothetical protein FA743_18080 [Paracoccus gahaiensis]|uniref:Sialate O-acetylesterase domain-containing protein n=1 Tax=Paracoccus gahaiensis TaxID=1706839 RepID=A0A4U0R409_9RHOB|nr:hypothetical protein FA743_18080 [Paracoccus gahaiensis]